MFLVRNVVTGGRNRSIHNLASKLSSSPLRITNIGNDVPSVIGSNSDGNRRYQSSTTETPSLSSFEERLKLLEARIQDLERTRQPVFRAGHYNILARYLGSNKEPWFLFDGLTGSNGDKRRSQAISAKHRERCPIEGHYKNVGWPTYVEGILTKEEILKVEERDRKHFHWNVRAPKILEAIKDLDADVLSLVEVDEYNEYFQSNLQDLGYDSIWVKSPRESSKDGCCVCWKPTKMELVASEPVHYSDDVEGIKRDRAALLTLFRLKHTHQKPDDPRLIFVSTHLARNPESKQQHAIRLRQAAQLMVQLKDFADLHQCDENVPVIVAGDWNAESLNEIRAVTQAFFALQDLQAVIHPLLLGSVDVPTPKTSFTLQRQSRIDYLMYSETFLQLKCVRRIELSSNQSDSSTSTTTIPNDQHPSDHLPISADFEFPTQYEISRECAKKFCASVLRGGSMRRPLLPNELDLAFKYFDHDGSATISKQEFVDGVRSLGNEIIESHKEIDLLLRECCVSDNDEEVTFEKFQNAYEKSFITNMKPDGDSFYEAVKSAFDFFDIDGNGSLTREEIETTLRSISPVNITTDSGGDYYDDDGGNSSHKIDTILKKIDIDGNGEVDLDEFVSAIVKVHHQQNSYNHDTTAKNQ